MFWKHNIFGSTTFQKLDVFEDRRFFITKFSRKIFVSVKYYSGDIISWKQDGNLAGQKASTTGSKHDGKIRSWAKTLISVLWNSSRKPEAREIFLDDIRINLESIKNI